MGDMAFKGSTRANRESMSSQDTGLSFVNSLERRSIKTVNLISELIEEKPKEGLFNVPALSGSKNINTTVDETIVNVTDQCSHVVDSNNTTNSTIVEDQKQIPQQHPADYSHSMNILSNDLSPLQMNNIMRKQNDLESFIYNDMSSIDTNFNNDDNYNQLKPSIIFNNTHTSTEPLSTNSILFHNSLRDCIEPDFLDTNSMSTAYTNDPHIYNTPMKNSSINGSIHRSPSRNISRFDLPLTFREYTRNERTKSLTSKVRELKQKLNRNNSGYNTLHEHDYGLVNEETGVYDFVSDSFLLKSNERSSLLNKMNNCHSSTRVTPVAISHKLHEFHLIPDDISPHNYKSLYNKRHLGWRIFSITLYLLIGLLLTSIITKVFIMKGFDNPLRDFNVVSLNNVLISEEILMFDVQTQAININYQDVNIWNLDLDIFIVTNEGHLKSTPEDSSDGNGLATILLGHSSCFLTPLTYTGSFPSSDSKINNSTAQLKLYKPGQFFQYEGKTLNHDQWLRIFNSNYKLIMRGNLQYQLPLTWKPKTININSETNVSPLFAN